MNSKQWYTIAYALRHGWLWIMAGLLILVWISLSFAWVRTTNESGNPLYWAERQVTLTLGLGCPSNPADIEAWGPCWNDVARHAAQAWNQAGARFQFQFRLGPITAPVSCTNAQVDEVNVVVVRPSICGRAWGDTIAITGTWYLSDGRLGDTDVQFNSGVSWAAYAGPPRFPFGEPLYEVHRVAMHEFGHVLGLAHPDDHGQTVRALMHSSGENGTLERLQADDIAGIRAIYGVQPATTTTKGTLENPGHQTFRSGVGVISGWVCTAQRVEIQIGQTRYRAIYGSDRPDTRSVCGDTNNGFGILFNFNRLRDGVHTARLVVDGQQLGNPAQFKVTTFGVEFLRGADGGYWLHDFPRPGTDVGVGWDQGTQNFMIEERR